jgi:hypothetical protein
VCGFLTALQTTSVANPGTSAAASASSTQVTANRAALRTVSATALMR